MIFKRMPRKGQKKRVLTQIRAAGTTYYIPATVKAGDSFTADEWLFDLTDIMKQSALLLSPSQADNLRRKLQNAACDIARDHLFCDYRQEYATDARVIFQTWPPSNNLTVVHTQTAA